MKTKELLQHTDMCYNEAMNNLVDLVANIVPAPHATKPISTIIESLKQNIVAQHINAKSILLNHENTIQTVEG